MKALLVNGGPHQFGCTYTALNEVATTLNSDGVETEILWLGNKPYQSCTACGSCKNGEGCIIKDGVNEFIEKAKEVDGLIIGSPVHYASATGAITTFMDRAFYAGARYFRGKLGASVVSCRRGGSTAALDQLNKYFTISSMPIVSSSYWNMIHGHTAEEALQDLEGLHTMRTLGHNMAWLLKCIELGKENDIEFKSYEKKVITNFIR